MVRILIIVIIVITLIIFLVSIKNTKNRKKGVYRGNYRVGLGSGDIYEIYCVVEVLLLERYTDNTIKVKVLAVHDINSDNYLASYIRDDIKTKLKSESIIINELKVDWVDGVSLDKEYLISNKDLSTLIKTGKVNIDDLKLTMGDDWDYKRGLDIIIESTK